MRTLLLRLSSVLIILVTSWIVGTGIVYPASVGPFELVSADSTSRLRLQFVGQLRMGYDSKDNGSGKARTKETGMEARRIRLTLSGSVFSSDLTYRLHLSTAPGSLELMDFYFNYRSRRWMEFRYGQYKVPFTRYRIQSFTGLTFADWAIVTKFFGAERQMGFALHNGYEKPPRWGYVFGVFTGVNARASHGIGVAKMYGEEVANPSNLADPGSRATFHPEVFVHLCYNGRGIAVQSDTDEEGGGLRYGASVSGAWDIDPTAYQDFSVRLAPELLIKYRGLSFFSVGYAGFAEVGAAQVNKLAMVGGLWQSAYRLNRRLEFSARYALVDFRDAVIDDARSRAAALIAGSQDELAPAELAALKTQYKDAGQVRREQEATLGCNVYLIGHALKWQNDASMLRHNRRAETRVDYQVRSQFQVAF